MDKSNNLNRNGPKIKIEQNDDDDSDHSAKTEPFSFDNFKTTSLNEKYSVHQNDAALEADFRRILADDSDMEMIEPAAQKKKSPQKQQNSTMDTSGSMKTSNDDQSLAKDDYVLSWAESVRTHQSQSLSMVASIMSDHNYLSQENTQEIMTSHEEHAANESQSKLAKEQNESSSSLADELPIDEINDLNAIMKQLIECKSRKSYKNLLNEIAEKTKLMKCHLGAENNTEQQDDFLFSRDHSEPLEYYGNTFREETSAEQSDGSGESFNFYIFCFSCFLKFKCFCLQIPKFID